jgi:Flp pilus assembly protein TadG/uncharacterized protein YegL
MIGKLRAHFSGLNILSDRRGNFGLMSAILLPVSLGVGGFAMDLTNVVQMKSELQGAADSAALAAASSMAFKGTSKDDAIAMAKTFLNSQVASYLSNGTKTDTELAADKTALGNAANIGVTTSGSATSGQTFDVTVKTYYDVPLNPLTQFIGYKTMRVAVSSTSQSATESKNALSMYLVLDRSGSMAWKTDTVDSSKSSCVNWTEDNWGKSNVKATSPCYVTKINSLKIAVNSLVSTLKTADPDTKYVRTGAVSYNSDMQSPSAVAWGETAMNSYVDALVADGGTDSSAAFNKAYTSLNDSAGTENAAHLAKNGQVPTKYILLMTDGENSSTAADTKTKTYCTNAKAAGIKIYTVAFMAPTRGQTLLNACSSGDGYYIAAEDATELVAAFKYIGEKASQSMTRLTN